MDVGKPRDDPDREDPFLDIDGIPKQTAVNGVLRVPEGWFRTSAGICRYYTDKEGPIAKEERKKKKELVDQYMSKHCCRKKKRVVYTCP